MRRREEAKGKSTATAQETMNYIDYDTRMEDATTPSQVLSFLASSFDPPWPKMGVGRGTGQPK